MRPTWQTDDGRVKLWLGDCLDVLPTLEAGSVDAVVTDPPYGVNLGETTGSGGSHGLNLEAYASYQDTYENFVEIIVPRLSMAIDTASRSVVWTGPHIHEQRKPSVVGGVYCPAGAGRHNWGFKTFLPVLYYGSAPDLHLGAPYPTTITSSERPKPNGHPCPKPTGWMVWSVNLASRVEQSVLDPFMGSGTTGVACVRLGRKFLGVEKEPKYFEIAKRRIIAELERMPLFEEKPTYRQAELV